MKRRSLYTAGWGLFFGFGNFCGLLTKKDRAGWFKKLLLFNSNGLLAAAAIKLTVGHFSRTNRGFFPAIGADFLCHNFGFFHFYSPFS
jgi:hypothetical protein